jgi:surface antigen
MRTRTRTLLAVLAAGLLALAGCATKQQTGMATGGILGGLAGSAFGGGNGKTAATIVGALAGAAIGSAVGRSMDQQDRLQTAQALETAPTGHATTWRNPDTGSRYTVTPTRTYYEDARPCRDYTMNAIVNGEAKLVHGTACRGSDGNWHVA